jgi:hypothetical protein
MWDDSAAAAAGGERNPVLLPSPLLLHFMISINQSKPKTSNVQNLTHLDNEHQAPDHEATQPMMGY